jgi:tetratricopeptide (TPR) repeat protein
MLPVEDLLRSGRECDAARDPEGAEAAYREADELHDAEGAILVRLMLQRRGDPRGAAEAFERSEARGEPEAASCLGNLLWMKTTSIARKAAYERSAAAGSTDAECNLGLLLLQQGAVDEALPYLRTAEDAGLPEGSWGIGKLLEDRQDFQGAATAYRRGADGGHAMRPTASEAS